MTYFFSEPTTVQFLLIITLVVWYEGFFTSIFYFRLNPLYPIRPLFELPISLWVQTLHLVGYVKRGYIRYTNLQNQRFDTSPLRLILPLRERLANYLTTSPTPLFNKVFESLIVGALFIIVSIMGFNILRNPWYRQTGELLNTVYLFFYRAFLPIYITWVLFLFIYRILVGANLLYTSQIPRPQRRRIDTLGLFIWRVYSANSISPLRRLSIWGELLLLLSDNLFFLKRYFRINDLIWQDGFLIDFLQKKVADKWIRTFVIYSGYLFNERYLFDNVTRFYIDFIIWPGYSSTIYEFNSVSSTLSVTLFLIMVITFVPFLIFLKLYLF